MPSDPNNQEFFHNFIFAIMAIFARYVFDVSTQIGKQKEQLKQSEFWSKTEERSMEAIKAARTATLEAITVCVMLIIASAIGISLPSRALDQRMIYILEGLSLVFSSVVMGLLSFEVATWTGVYFEIWQEQEQETSTCLKELKFMTRWNYYRIFGRYFFFLWPFYQGVTAITIPISMLAGIAAGLAIDFCVYFARRHEKYKWFIVISMIFIIVGGASVLFAIGVYFIVKVWEQATTEKRYVVFLSSLIASFVVGALLHVCRWFISRKQFQKLGKAEISIMETHRPRMVASLIFSYYHEQENISKKKMSDASDSEQMDEAPFDETINETDAVEKGVNVGDAQVSKNQLIADDNGGEEPVTVVESELSGPDTNSDVKADATSGPDNNGEAVEDVHKEEESQEPSYKQLFCTYWTCCGCVRGDDSPQSEKVWSFLYWFVWYILVLFSLYLVAVNLGATYQQEHAREKLPYVESVLYDYMDEGPVCAFDNKGEDSNITTFPDKEAAHAEGFLVLHCGECAACSDWHNLRQEYATRDFLASESAKCAKKSLFGGRQAVLDCLEEPPIDFQGKCAECWADDILCTKDFCAVIFLQSTIINSVSNFQVSADSITSATCEEAHCEAGNPGAFVYCSGATRRRMNITSTIQRPGAQRCGIVDVDWAELFPDAA